MKALIQFFFARVWICLLFINKIFNHKYNLRWLKLISILAFSLIRSRLAPLPPHKRRSFENWFWLSVFLDDCLLFLTIPFDSSPVVYLHGSKKMIIIIIIGKSNVKQYPLSRFLDTLLVTLSHPKTKPYSSSGIRWFASRRRKKKKVGIQTEDRW